MNGFVGALCLARREMKGAWPSYSLTGLFVAFLGLFAVASLSGVFELEGFGEWGRRMEGYYNTFFLDYLFLAVCGLLGVSTVSGGRAPLLSRGAWRDSSPSRRFIFLRELPISSRSLVGSRMISMLFALTLNATAFFVPLYLLSDLGELGTSYLWFAGVWIGYALATSGLWLLCELTLIGDRAHTLFAFGLAASLVVVVLFIEWTLEPGLVETTARLAHSHGALFATLSVLGGGTVLALLLRLTARRIEKRDLSGDFSS